jgi:hypothetical protein
MRRRISSGVACLEIICDRNEAPINLIGHLNNEPLACVERNGPAASKRMDAMLLDAVALSQHTRVDLRCWTSVHHFWLVSRGQRALLHNSHVGTRKTNELSQGQDFFCNLLKQFYDVASTKPIEDTIDHHDWSKSETVTKALNLCVNILELNLHVS